MLTQLMCDDHDLQAEGCLGRTITARSMATTFTIGLTVQHFILEIYQ
jgi:hypothetical protein